MKRFLYLLAIVLLLIVMVVLVRTFTISSKQVKVEPAKQVTVADSVISHLQQAIRFKTISVESKTVDSIAFKGFHQMLETAFPLLHRQCTREVVNKYSLLFYWKGKNPSIRPILLTGHQDVVPVEEATLSLWQSDPFAGNIKDGFIYGRGVVDDKGSLVALLEAVEQLLREGFQPAGDVYIALGHDEEATGKDGAKEIASLLSQRSIKPAFVLDEGGEITDHEVPGITKPVALVGIAEKGFVTVDLSINITGGHSSMPAKQTAIDQLAKAVVRLKENSFPASLNPTIHAFMDYMGPEMTFVNRMAFANRWLLSPLIKNIYSRKPGPDAMIRTTTAPTIFHSGIKENVIPSVASATVNFRTLPGTMEADVLKHIKEVIKDDRITIEARQAPGSINAVAEVNDKSFTYMQQSIRSWRPEVIVTPYLVLGATDGRYYAQLTPQVYRFIPFNDIHGFHGIDERIGVEEYKKGIAFYYGLIKGWK